MPAPLNLVWKIRFWNEGKTSVTSEACGLSSLAVNSDSKEHYDNSPESIFSELRQQEDPLQGTFPVLAQTSLGTRTDFLQLPIS